MQLDLHALKVRLSVQARASHCVLPPLAPRLGGPAKLSLPLLPLTTQLNAQLLSTPTPWASHPHAPPSPPRPRPPPSPPTSPSRPRPTGSRPSPTSPQPSPARPPTAPTRPPSSSTAGAPTPSTPSPRPGLATRSTTATTTPSSPSTTRPARASASSSRCAFSAAGTSPPRRPCSSTRCARLSLLLLLPRSRPFESSRPSLRAGRLRLVVRLCQGRQAPRPVGHVLALWARPHPVRRRPAPRLVRLGAPHVALAGGRRGVRLRPDVRWLLRGRAAEGRRRVRQGVRHEPVPR